MRKLIAAFKTTLDGKIESSLGFADWVDGWSEDYNLRGHIDACILGSIMYNGYEQYWTAIIDAPNGIHPMTEKYPTSGEIEWSKFAKNTPHYVLTHEHKEYSWPNTQSITSIEAIATLKEQTGKDIYLMGGADIFSKILDADLIDELRLIIYPIIIGTGKPLFINELSHNLELKECKATLDGLLHLTYKKHTSNIDKD